MFLKRSSKLAIVDFDGRNINYNEMVDSIKYLSRNIFLNINEADKVLIVAENRLEWVYSFFAIWDRLATPIPVDALSNSDEIKYFVNNSDSNVVIVTNKTKHLVEGLDVITYNLDEINIGILTDDEELKHPVDNNVALMIYTSGTTGLAKAVMLSFNNLLAEMRGIKSLGFTSEDEQVLAILPFHHIFPLVSTGLYFYHHEQMYSVVLVPKLTSAEIFRCLRENNVTGLSLVPRVYKMFYDNLKEKIESSFIARNMYSIARFMDSPKFSKLIFRKVHKAFGGKLRTLVSGGGSAPYEMIEFFNNLGFLFCEGYGLSETSPVIAGSGRTYYRPGTVGKPIIGAEVKLENDELLVKSDVVMLGYYKDEQKTAKVLTKDGWFKTGDKASISSDGYIKIIGRINEMIVLTNGKNVNPLVLEEKFMNYSNNLVEEIGIFSNNDRLCAIIVPNSSYIMKNKVGNIATHIKDIIETYNSKVHNYEKILDYVIKNDALPKTRVGKLQRFKLKDIYFSKNVKKKDDNKPTTKEYKYLEEYLLKLKHLDFINQDDNFEVDLGLDSLDLVEFKLYIENTYNLVLSDDVFVVNNNLLKLSEYIISNSNEFNDINNQSINDIIKNTKETKEFKTSFLAKISGPVIYCISKIYFRIKIIGKDKIIDEPTIFIANHESFLDAPLLALAIPYNIRLKTYFLGLKMYFSSRLMSYLAKKLNIIQIDIENDIKETLQELTTVIRSKGNIFIFPEGSRTKDGNLQEFKKMFAILAKELNVDVQCISIKGAYEAYGRFDKFIKPKKITVEVLDRIKTKDLDVLEIVDRCTTVFKENKGER